MGRRARPLWLALAVSLLLHLALIAGPGWHLPRPGEPVAAPVFDAQLAPAPKPVAAAAPASVPPRRHAPRPRRAPLPRPQPVVPQAAKPAPAPRVPASAHEANADSVPPAPAAAPVVPVEPPPLPLNALPPRIELRYRLHYGLVTGEQTLLWVTEGEHYTLTSVVAASGLAGVFYRGRFVQTSRGRITSHGLQPEEFWDQRGDKRSTTRFDAQGAITLMPEQGEPRHFKSDATVQDALSVFFQLALTAPPGPHFSYAVFNGKKLRNYSYEVRGEETLDTAIGALRTLHLVRAGDSDDRFEAWLAVDRYFLPVRVLMSDDKGRSMEMLVQSITP